MAKPSKGTKRACKSCGVKFYDLERDPIVCPACGVTFTFDAPAPKAAPKARPAAAAPKTRARAGEPEAGQTQGQARGRCA